LTFFCHLHIFYSISGSPAATGTSLFGPQNHVAQIFHLVVNILLFNVLLFYLTCGNVKCGFQLWTLGFIMSLSFWYMIAMTVEFSLTRAYFPSLTVETPLMATRPVHVHQNTTLTFLGGCGHIWRFFKFQSLNQGLWRDVGARKDPGGERALCGDLGGSQSRYKQS